MRIYNLFPPLAGYFSEWKPHLTRAAEMGFNWVFVNPIQQPGKSGSLYSIKDYFSINPAFCKTGRKTAEDQVRAVIAEARKLGVRMMVDLVINHCAFDSPILKQHPTWFVTDAGKVVHPSCVHEGETVVWRDLAQFDHARTADAEGLFRYCRKIVQYLIDLGFDGFRCDAAYQIPATFWRRLIEDVKESHPGTVFVAETLGCSPHQTLATAQAGFDAIFNSSKWWDFESPWLLEQYQLTRTKVPSISFAESHDTPRLFEECGGNADVMMQRYLFSALFSTGIMMPMGFEFGFRRPLHVVDSKPSDWESPNVDLTAFIREVNHIKSTYRVFHEEGAIETWTNSNPSIALIWKVAVGDASQALIILNKDPWNRQYCRVDSLYHYVQSAPPLIDVSTRWPMDYLPTPFEYELLPGMARVLVTGNLGWRNG